jgi:transposase-like protein
MGTEAPTPLLIPRRCAPRKAPCPPCGKPGRRKRTLHRRVRTLAFQVVAFLDITYGEYRASCSCCKSFRNTPPGVAPKAHYDDRVRQLVLDRILRDAMSIERTLASLRREFLLDLSLGFVYDVLHDEARRLDLAEHRRMVLRCFRGTLCVDELHLGRHTLLLATDPLRDLPVAFALVDPNDQGHMRRFLKNLKTWGLSPRVVVTDGSNLYPSVLAELWPEADHQLCVFHALQDINGLILDAVRRLRTRMTRRGNAGRRRRRGRKTRQAQAAAKSRGPTLKEKAKFVFTRRYLLVKRRADLTEHEQAELAMRLAYLPELGVLRRFTDRVHWLFDTPKDRHQAGCRRVAVLRDPAFGQVPELVKAMELLASERFAKLTVYLKDPAGRRVRTNNHVERTNRLLRFFEKVRYKWRRRRTLVRFVVLILNLRWSEVPPKPIAGQSEETAARKEAKQGPPRRKVA